MVLLSENKLIIEIEHPCPEDFIKDIEFSIISVLQDRELNEVTDLIKFKETNNALLELLKQLF